jgi:hypothetical protein
VRRVGSEGGKLSVKEDEAEGGGGETVVVGDTWRLQIGSHVKVTHKIDYDNKSIFVTAP